MNDEFQKQQEKLKVLTERSDTIPYVEEAADHHLPGLSWSVYGVTSTNEIVVKATAGTFTVYDSVPSPMLVPPMTERKFGMDVADEQASGALSLRISDVYGETIREALEKSC